MKVIVNPIDSDSRSLLMIFNLLKINPEIENLEDNSKLVTPILEVDGLRLNGLLPSIYYLRDKYKESNLFKFEESKIKDFEILIDYYFSNLKAITDYVKDKQDNVDNFLNKKFVDNSLDLIENNYLKMIKDNNYEIVKIMYSNEIMNLTPIKYELKDYPKIQEMVLTVRKEDKENKYANKLIDLFFKKNNFE